MELRQEAIEDAELIKAHITVVYPDMKANLKWDRVPCSAGESEEDNNWCWVSKASSGHDYMHRLDELWSKYTEKIKLIASAYPEYISDFYNQISSEINKIVIRLNALDDVGEIDEEMFSRYELLYLQKGIFDRI